MDISDRKIGQTWSSFVRFRPAALSIEAKRTMERPMTNARTGFGCGEGAIQVKSREVTQPPMSSLLDLIEQTHFLRMLLADPDRVVPPGKSLLSMLTNAKEKDSAILDGVTQVAHRAFWDEVCSNAPVIIQSNILRRL